MSEPRVIPLHRPEAAAEPSDAELIARVARKDAAAFARLYERHHALVFRHLGRLVRSSSEVDDLVQSTFLELWRHAASYRAESSARAFLLGVAYNLHRRSNRGWFRRLRLIEAVKRQPAEHSTDPTPELERRALVRRLDQAMARLSPALREVFVLCDVEGVEQGEAAIILDLPPSTLRRRLAEARKRLRTFLEAMDHG